MRLDNTVDFHVRLSLSLSFSLSLSLASLFFAGTTRILGSSNPCLATKLCSYSEQTRPLYSTFTLSRLRLPEKRSFVDPLRVFNLLLRSSSFQFFSAQTVPVFPRTLLDRSITTILPFSFNTTQTHTHTHKLHSEHSEGNMQVPFCVICMFFAWFLVSTFSKDSNAN